ncbi:MAG TPA: hypothetical protein VIY29_11175 [Ktedonobacteraceae bacterium]
MMVHYGEQRKMHLLVKGVVRCDLCQKRAGQVFLPEQRFTSLVQMGNLAHVMERNMRYTVCCAHLSCSRRRTAYRGKLTQGRKESLLRKT